MKYLIGAMLFSLVGCTSVPTIYKKVEVEIPVPVSCLTHDMIPEKVVSASEMVRMSDSPGEKIRAVLVEREQLLLSNEQMRVILNGCI